MLHFLLLALFGLKMKGLKLLFVQLGWYQIHLGIQRLHIGTQSQLKRGAIVVIFLTLNRPLLGIPFQKSINFLFLAKTSESKNYF